MSESERFAHIFDKSVGLVRKWFIVSVLIKSNGRHVMFVNMFSRINKNGD